MLATMHAFLALPSICTLCCKPSCPRLTFKFPTWRWEEGDAGLRASYLPKERQYLITRRACPHQTCMWKNRICRSMSSNSQQLQSRFVSFVRNLFAISLLFCLFWGERRVGACTWLCLIHKECTLQRPGQSSLVQDW